jgi:hypothetical protein
MFTSFKYTLFESKVSGPKLMVYGIVAPQKYSYEDLICLCFN